MQIELSEDQREALLNILGVTRSGEVRERLIEIMGPNRQKQAEKTADEVHPLFLLFLNAH